MIFQMSVLFPYFSNVRVVSALDDTESSGEVDGLGFSGLGDASTEAEEETFITTERPGDDRSFASIHQVSVSEVLLAKCRNYLFLQKTRIA